MTKCPSLVIEKWTLICLGHLGVYAIEPLKALLNDYAARKAPSWSSGCPFSTQHFGPAIGVYETHLTCTDRKILKHIWPIV